MIFLLVENVALNKTAYQTNPYRKDNDFFLTLATQSIVLNQTYIGPEVNVLYQLLKRKLPPGGLTLAVFTASTTSHYLTGRTIQIGVK